VTGLVFLFDLVTKGAHIELNYIRSHYCKILPSFGGHLRKCFVAIEGNRLNM
jgi:hypothetical protein